MSEPRALLAFAVLIAAAVVLVGLLCLARIWRRGSAPEWETVAENERFESIEQLDDPRRRR